MTVERLAEIREAIHDYPELVRYWTARELLAEVDRRAAEIAVFRQDVDGWQQATRQAEAVRDAAACASRAAEARLAALVETVRDVAEGLMLARPSVSSTTADLAAQTLRSACSRAEQEDGTDG
jgi:hypothetical protein